MSELLKLYTVSEVSKILKVNRNKVYMLIHAGELRAINVGSMKVTHEDLIAFISSRSLNSEAGKGEIDWQNQKSVPS